VSDMKNKLMLILVVIIAVAFFLPWVSVESEVVGSITKLLTGKKQAATVSISGFQVPLLANSEESKLMITIIKIFQPGITNADKKSFLIWIIPLMAGAFYFLGNKFKDQKWVKLAMGIIGITIFVIATFKIMTTNLDKVVMKMNIGVGLWLILIGYLGIGIIQITDFMRLNKSGK